VPIDKIGTVCYIGMKEIKYHASMSRQHGSLYDRHASGAPFCNADPLPAADSVYGRILLRIGSGSIGYVVQPMVVRRRCSGKVELQSPAVNVVHIKCGSVAM
jgi:hypothetical protein